MAFLLRFALLAGLKLLTRLLYRFEVGWVEPPPPRPFEGARVALLMNHTSLFEFLFAGALPLSFLRDLAARGVMPGADATLDRPVVGRFFKWLVATPVTVTRRRDRTWDAFLDSIGPESVVLMSPEGRMMRRDGLDKDGRPMTVRGGIADVLERVSDGRMILLHSAGLHHVQAPGEGVPRLFKTLKGRFELLDIAAYRRRLGAGSPEFKAAVAKDLQARLERHRGEQAPPLTGSPKIG